MPRFRPEHRPGWPRAPTVRGDLRRAGAGQRPGDRPGRALGDGSCHPGSGPPVPGRGRSRRACAPGGGLGLAHRPSSSGRMGRPLADGRVDGRRPPRDRHHQPVCRRPPVDPRGGRRVAPLRAARPAGTNRPAGPNDLDVGAPPDSRRDATPASLDAPAACPPWRVTRPEAGGRAPGVGGAAGAPLGGAGAH